MSLGKGPQPIAPEDLVAFPNGERYARARSVLESPGILRIDAVTAVHDGKLDAK